MARIAIRENNASEIRRGVTLMVTGSTLIPGLDACAKILTETHGLSPVAVAFIRFVLQAAMVLPFVLAFNGAAALRIKQPVLNLSRGILLAAGSICFFLALKFMPLADATAIFFVEPILATVLSAIVLREKVRPARVVAVLIGFSGTLLVVRPNFAAFGFVAVLPVATAFLVALYSILARRLAGSGTPLALHFYTGVGGVITLAPLLAFGGLAGIEELAVAIPFDRAVYGLFLLLGVIATVGHLMFIQAYHDAPLSALAPLGYVEVPSAVVFGFVLFGQFPDTIALAGIAVIMASGLVLVARRESVAPPPPQP